MGKSRGLATEGSRNGKADSDWFAFTNQILAASASGVQYRVCATAIPLPRTDSTYIKRMGGGHVYSGTTSWPVGRRMNTGPCRGRFHSKRVKRTPDGIYKGGNG
ncbi:hypothetical protein CDEST_03285 [Colletotrichum destructivum]|uniref:Uncharacterized protein n=1 Tax=Colletotrichum destructivum TaxID=34406 RepID=A0AAX4I4X0_9PEZI|nr:hypothetical protein CDEST_03285 [Colletotrichum destructivum]